MTGCGRFAATCDVAGRSDRSSSSSWPRWRPAARVPAARLADDDGRPRRCSRRRGRRALILSATGAAADGDSRRAALGVVLLFAWLVGLWRRRRPAAGSAPSRRADASRILSVMPRRHDQRDLSAAAQEYLLALRVLVGPDDTSRVTAAQIARHLGVTTQAASEMFRRLVADGLVAHAEGRDLHLSPAGRAAADGIFRRHALLEWLLTSVIGLGWAESDDEAMRLQGAISPRVEARLDEMLGHPETCPHGNPIDAETARRRPAGIRLSEMEAGIAGHDLPDHRGGRGGRRAAVVPRGARADARRARSRSWPAASRSTRSRSTVRAGARRWVCGRPRWSGSCPARPTRRCSTSSRPSRPEMTRDPRVRIAPSPTGPLHIGTARTALFNYLLRAPHRRHVHPPPRGHRPGARLDRLREGHPRRAALAGPRTGTRARRSPARRHAGPFAPVPPDAAPAALRRGRRTPARRRPGLSVLLHARGARRRPQGAGGGQAAAALRRALRRT